MEDAKAEVEKKVSKLLKYIENKNKIPKVTKRELVGIVKDLQEQCQLLYSVYHKGKPGAALSSRSSSSDLDYYSSEEIDVSETRSSDYGVMLRKIQETELANEDLKRQLSNLKQEMEPLGKRNEDRDRSKGLKGEVALLASQLEKKTNEIVEEKKALWNKVEKLQVCVDSLQKQRKKMGEDLKCKTCEIDRLMAENHKMHTRMDSLQQEDTIEKLSEDQKLMKRWSFGSKLNTHLLEKKMEELSQDFQMKMEDRIRILYRRIHVAEQIHLDNKNNYKQTQEKRGDLKKIKDLMDKGLAGPEMLVKKLEQGQQLTTKVTRLAKEIDSARKWVHDKNNKMKHEVETLEAKLECSQAQETLLKEKLSKLEGKLGEEGTGKMSVEKAIRRIKKLEIHVKERDVELMCLGEEKREAIRQLCVFVDYQRCRYEDLKTSISNVALQA